jgi:uncharacterized lipoprotein YajG
MIRYLSFKWLYVLLSLLLAGCQTTPSALNKTQSSAKSTLIHQDSTVYFAKKTASISMRASFSNTSGGVQQSLVDGYKLQFRSIQKRNISIRRVSIIAGGKKIILSEQGFLLPPHQGATLPISIEDTHFIAQQEDAVLRFKYEGESQLMTIRQHRLKEFSL